VDFAGLLKWRTTKEHVEKTAGERNGQSRFQVQLDKDGGSSTRQSWMEIIVFSSRVGFNVPPNTL